MIRMSLSRIAYYLQSGGLKEGGSTDAGNLSAWLSFDADTFLDFSQRRKVVAVCFYFFLDSGVEFFAERHGLILR